MRLAGTFSKIAEEEELGSWEGVSTDDLEAEDILPNQLYTINYGAPTSPGSSMNGCQVMPSQD